MRKNDCKVCLAAPKTRLLVDEGLVKGISVRDLAEMSGVSKSAIGRHKQNPNCLVANVGANTKREKILTEAQIAAREDLKGTPIDDGRPELGKIGEKAAEIVPEKAYLAVPVHQPIRIKPGVDLSAFDGDSAPETHEDLLKTTWDICKFQAKIAKDAYANGSLRVASGAADKILSPLTLAAKAMGLISETPSQDNRQVNIFQGVPVEKLDKMLALFEDDAA